MKMIKLSILIPTMLTRIDSYYSIIKELKKQMNENNLNSEVEIISMMDDGSICLGDKRNLLIDKSTGVYIVFIDDDDRLSKNYLYKIINVIHEGSDCITFNGEYHENGVYKADFLISNDINDNYNTPMLYYRRPNHICPVKREIAVKSRFPSKYFGEDTVYSDRMKKYLKTESHISDKLYYYIFDTRKSETFKYR